MLLFNKSISSQNASNILSSNHAPLPSMTHCCIHHFTKTKHTNLIKFGDIAVTTEINEKRSEKHDLMHLPFLASTMTSREKKKAKSKVEENQ